MPKPLEFSDVFKLLYAIKEGDESKKHLLNSILTEFKEGKSTESFLHELGQRYLYIGIEELFKYTNSIDLQVIDKLTKEDWEELAIKNNSELPVHLANTMIFYAKENQLVKELSSKWETSKREVEKHVMPLARYITEGLIDVLE